MGKASVKLSPVAQAYERCKVARLALREIDARCMEVTENKAGILWERWIIDTTAATGKPGHVSVILMATPHWWDVYAPVTRDRDINATIAAIKALAA